VQSGTFAHPTVFRRADHPSDTAWRTTRRPASRSTSIQRRPMSSAWRTPVRSVTMIIARQLQSCSSVLCSGSLQDSMSGGLFALRGFDYQVTVSLDLLLGFAAQEVESAARNCRASVGGCDAQVEARRFGGRSCRWPVAHVARGYRSRRGVIRMTARKRLAGRAAARSSKSGVGGRGSRMAFTAERPPDGGERALEVVGSE
jgi:hypothetical protein